MASAAAPADQAAELLQKMALDPKTNQGANGSEAENKSLGAHKDAVKNTVVPSSAITSSDRPTTPFLYPASTYYYGGYGSIGGWDDYSTYLTPNGSEGSYGDVYQHAYAYQYGSYPSSHVPSYGHDGQLYGSQHFPYSSSYYQQSTPKSSSNAAKRPTSIGDMPASAGVDQLTVVADNAKVAANGLDGIKSVKKTDLPPKLNQTSVTSGGLYTRPTGRSSTYHSNGFGYDGSSAKSKAQIKNQSVSSIPYVSGYSTPTSPSGLMNRMYSNGGIYGHTGSSYRPGYWYGSHLYGTGLGAWGSYWGGKYRPSRGRPVGSHMFVHETLDGLNELKRGPRNGTPKTQPSTGSSVDSEVNGQDHAATGNEELVCALIKDYSNQEDLAETYEDAKFFIIKSYSEDDVHKSVKYGVWASTPNGNKKLDAAYKDASEKQGSCPVFLFFSVNTSGQFVGLAEMTGRVDFEKTVEYWQQDKWHGCFPVKWRIVKDVPNNLFKHIILENNENKPVTNSRDTQEVKLDQGLQMLKIFKDHVCKTSILDDFTFYDTREKVMQERRAKQLQMPRKVVDERLVSTLESAVASKEPHSQSEVAENSIDVGSIITERIDANLVI